MWKLRWLNFIADTRKQAPRSNTNRARTSEVADRPDGRSVRISTAEKPLPDIRAKSDREITSSIRLHLLAFLSADWRLFFAGTFFSARGLTTSPRTMNPPRTPKSRESQTTFRELLCRVHHEERMLPCEAMTPGRIRIPGLARDGEWLAAAHSHFASNRLNKPPVTLDYYGFDMLYAPTATRLCELTRAMYPATKSRHVS